MYLATKFIVSEASKRGLIFHFPDLFIYVYLDFTSLKETRSPKKNDFLVNSLIQNVVIKNTLSNISPKITSITLNHWAL